MFYTIYRVTNKLNGKVYIGSHKTTKLDDGYMGSGKYLKLAIAKDGLESFEKEILFVFDNPQAMYAKEAELVNGEFLAEANTYNLKVGGFGGFDYINDSKLDKFKGKKHSEATKILISKSSSERTHTQETKDKIAAANTRRDPLIYENLSKKLTGRKLSEETKRKIAESVRRNYAGKVFMDTCEPSKLE